MADQQSLFPETGQAEKSLKDAANKPLSRIELPVYGMSCGKCVARVTTALQSVAGVHDVNVLLDRELAQIDHDPEQADRELFEQAVIAAGYSCQPVLSAEELIEPPSAALDPENDHLPNSDSDINAPERFRFAVRGMTCATCAATITKRLKATTGVHSVTVNFADESATVEFDPETTGREEIFKAVEKAGYKPLTNRTTESDQDESRRELHWLIFAAVLALPIMPLMWWQPFGAQTIYVIMGLATVSQFSAGLTFYRGAWH